MNRPSSRKLPTSVSETIGAEEASDQNPLQLPRPSSPNPYMPGEIIGDRYRLVREIGRGGMGVVWVAHSLVLGVDVAVKLLRATGGDSGVASRMAREAHAAARVGHPALVRVFDFGWTGRGDPYLVMELVAGETVSALLAREVRIDAIRAVQMILPIADGLRVAHDKHIIHRDIKPDNIFLATDTFGRTQPKLLDFGIAKIDVNAHDGKLTQVGVVLGSPEYMSPEQAVGADDVDERTDVWSLSVVLYELVTGSVPFSRANYNALMQAIIHDQPTAMTDLAAGDPALWQVIEKGLTKDREHRWSNMTEFGEALALWLYEHGIKEDLSGNSIRAVWLDGPLSGVRHEVRSPVPPWLAGAAAPAETQVHDAALKGTSLSGRLARRLGLKSLWHALAMVILAAGLVGLSAILLVMLRGNAGHAQPSTPALGNPMSSAPDPSTSAATADKREPTLAASIGPAAGLTDSNTASPKSAETKRTPAKASSSTGKSTKRASRRSHDFGF